MKNIYYIASEKRYVGKKLIHGHQITVHAKKQLDCSQKLSEEIRKFKAGIKQSTNIVSKKITLIEYFNKWYNQDKKANVVSKTSGDIVRSINNLKQLHDIPLEKLNKDMIVSVLNEMPKSRKKEKTVLYFNALLKSAVANRIIKYNPFDTIVKAPKINKHREAFTYEEQVQLLEALKNNPIKPIILIYLVTGLRKEEFNFKSIENDINFNLNILKARNLKGRNFEIRYKQIRLTNETVTLIMNNLDLIHNYNSYLIYHEFKKIMGNLGINKSIQNLRHTFATNHLYLGTPEFVIAKEMGHSTSIITKEHYMHIDYNLSKEKLLKLYNNLYSNFG